MSGNNPISKGGESVGAAQSMQILAGYLERALDEATSVVMMRHVPDVCTVYLGDPSGPREELRKIGSMPVALADDIFKSTSSGANHLFVDGQPYRFVRSFTQIESTAAVVFWT